MNSGLKEKKKKKIERSQSESQRQVTWHGIGNWGIQSIFTFPDFITRNDI
jgi:hypothetical protein